MSHFAKKTNLCCCACQQGFTLLEMVLVLLIMGMVASLSVAFIDNEDNQLRYQESMSKLTVLHDSVIAERRYQDQVLLSGFVIDNGVLPPGIPNLINTPPAGWIPYSSIQPQYKILSSHSSYSGVTSVLLNKGYRIGALRSGIDSLNNFKDGWGDDFVLSAASNDLTLQYSGTGKGDQFNADVNKDVNEGDWSIALSEINSITIENQTGAAIADMNHNINGYFVAISIFKNLATATPNDQWHTFHATLGATLGAVAISDGDSHVFSLTWFKEDGSTDANSERVPAGEHAIFIVKKDSHTTVKAKAILKVMPRFTQPTIKLVIK